MATDMKWGISHRYLRSAIFSAREAARIEKAGREKAINEFLDRIHVARNEMGRAVASEDPHFPSSELHTHVCGAVLFAASAIEAAANSFYVDAAEGDLRLGKLDAEVLLRLKTLWNELLRSTYTSPLKKIQSALAFTGCQPFDKGQPPYQDADTLFEVRNSLVHFIPEWLSKQRQHARIEQRLRSLRLGPNPFAPEDAAAYPWRLLGADLATWAARSAYQLVLEFYDRIGLDGSRRSLERIGYYLRELNDWEPLARNGPRL